jgi:hypothetical protein
MSEDPDARQRRARELIGNGPKPAGYLDAIKCCQREIGRADGPSDRAIWEKLQEEVERQYRVWRGLPPQDWRYPNPDTE